MNRRIFALLLPVLLPGLLSAQEPAGTAVLVTGVVTVASATGTRSLTADDAVYAGETLTVGPNSYVNLEFADGGRILLRPDTEFTVEAFDYAPGARAAQAEPAAGQAFFRLLRGGFRAISGLIGRDGQNYRVTTPAATIGIRGTDYEVQLCSTDCPDVSRPAQAALGGVQVASAGLAGVQLAQAGGGGVLVATNDGVIALQTGRGEFLVKEGEVAFALASGQVFMLPVVPDALLLNMTPSPAACE